MSSANQFTRITLVNNRAYIEVFDSTAGANADPVTQGCAESTALESVPVLGVSVDDVSCTLFARRKPL